MRRAKACMASVSGASSIVTSSTLPLAGAALSSVNVLPGGAVNVIKAAPSRSGHEDRRRS